MNQFSGDYDAKNERKEGYLIVVPNLEKDFEFFKLTTVPWEKNFCADVLVTLGSKTKDHIKRTILIQRIETPNIVLESEKDDIMAPIS